MTTLGRDGRCGGRLLAGSFVGAGQCDTGAAEDIEAEVAAAFDPFAVLFG
jgi:hypothetical protein